MLLGDDRRRRIWIAAGPGRALYGLVAVGPGIERRRPPEPGRAREHPLAAVLGIPIAEHRGGHLVGPRSRPRRHPDARGRPNARRARRGRARVATGARARTAIAVGRPRRPDRALGPRRSRLRTVPPRYRSPLPLPRRGRRPRRWRLGGDPGVVDAQSTPRDLRDRRGRRGRNLWQLQAGAAEFRARASTLRTELGALDAAGPAANANADLAGGGDPAAVRPRGFPRPGAGSELPDDQRPLRAARLLGRRAGRPARERSRARRPADGRGARDRADRRRPWRPRGLSPARVGRRFRDARGPARKW